MNSSNDEPNIDTDSRLIDLLEIVKQNPEGCKNILEYEQESRPGSGFDDLVPNMFRYPKIQSKKQKIFTSQSKADGKQGREEGGRRMKSKSKINKSELDSLPVEFDTILSKIGKSANKRIQIKRAQQSEINQSEKAIARVVKHKDNPISQTVFIKNSPEAHKALGVRNAPNEINSSEYIR